MTPDIHQLIAAISPETYCTPSKRREARRLLDEGLKKGDPLAIRHAAEIAEPRECNDDALDALHQRSAFDCVGLKHPLERHSYSYDCMDDSLEAFYFNLLDWLQGQGWQVAKLVDHLSSAAGSGFAGDLSRRDFLLAAHHRGEPSCPRHFEPALGGTLSEHLIHLNGRRHSLYDGGAELPECKEPLDKPLSRGTDHEPLRGSGSYAFRAFSACRTRWQRVIMIC